MWFDVRWPDGTRDRLYSPSLVVGDHLTVGEHYPVADFVARSRTALGIASDRVQAKFGFPCSRSAVTLAHIEAAAATHDSAGSVVIEAFDPPA
jgi:uncharacterized repeat protein (TIGR04042 family)